MIFFFKTLLQIQNTFSIKKRIRCITTRARAILSEHFALARVSTGCSVVKDSHEVSCLIRLLFREHVLIAPTMVLQFIATKASLIRLIKSSKEINF